jgi:hypothetical protein
MILRKINITVFVALALLASKAASEQTSFDDSSVVEHFEISPKVCVARVVGENCTMTAQIKWRSREKVNLCLFQNQLKLRCWQNTEMADESLKIKLLKQSNMALISDESKKVMATKKINVQYQVNQKYRRRLRADWSIF